jgi:uncharacterized membrane protein YphA (DoxX/SURF4 family)
VYAAVYKLIDVQKFRVQIGQSPFLTDIAPFVAWFIPVTEILIALMLAIPRFRLMGLYASFSLMAMFTTYIVVILNFSSHIPCSCGGVLEAMGWTEHLIFNIGFTLLAAIGVIFSSSKQSADKQMNYREPVNVSSLN